MSQPSGPDPSALYGQFMEWLRASRSEVAPSPQTAPLPPQTPPSSSTSTVGSSNPAAGPASRGSAPPIGPYESPRYPAPVPSSSGGSMPSSAPTLPTLPPAFGSASYPSTPFPNHTPPTSHYQAIPSNSLPPALPATQASSGQTSSVQQPSQSFAQQPSATFQPFAQQLPATHQPFLGRDALVGPLGTRNVNHERLSSSSSHPRSSSSSRGRRGRGPATHPPSLPRASKTEKATAQDCVFEQLDGTYAARLTVRVYPPVCI